MKHSRPYVTGKAALDSGVVNETFIRSMRKAKTANYRKASGYSVGVTASGMNPDECAELDQRVWDERPRIADDQAAKGLAWLLNLWKTPKGAERKNNPFGYCETRVLEDFSHFELAGFYDAGRNGWPNYLPLYNVISKAGASFQYYAGSWQSGVGISIVG